MLRFRTENRIVKDSFSVIMCCYACYLLKICSERWNKILNICTCNISAICTEMTNIHDDMIGLWQLLYICKAEKTHLNDKVVLRGLCVYRTVADKLQKIRTLNLLCLKDNGMYLTPSANKSSNNTQESYKNKRQRSIFWFYRGYS